ncbi:hypothetical protein E1A91_D03G000200v1 [Gossypium mustelinum]|uniref:Uncharacterized protein n=1 Tax=Gossypium mustelinum TaxID=34275 RepID=A0A5D2VGX4_GOSMU|nr:hypothetical protein E1A91_D03G000200v1 [Gossypium mustelinum]
MMSKEKSSYTLCNNNRFLFLLTVITIVTNASITQINTVDSTFNKHSEYSTYPIIKNIYVPPKQYKLLCNAIERS